MKKSLFILAVIFFSSINVFAAELVKGKILTSNDTLDVTFKISVDVISKEPNYMKLQEMVQYYNAAGKLCVLSPAAAKEIQFTYKGVEIRMLSRFLRNGIFQYTFLKLIIDGDVKLFNYYYQAASNTGGGSYQMNVYVLQKDADNLVAVNVMSFKEDMSAYFSECPVLAEKIEDKTYRLNDMETIVQYYNSNCR